MNSSHMCFDQLQSISLNIEILCSATQSRESSKVSSVMRRQSKLLVTTLTRRAPGVTQAGGEVHVLRLLVYPSLHYRKERMTEWNFDR